MVQRSRVIGFGIHGLGAVAVLSLASSVVPIGILLPALIGAGVIFVVVTSSGGGGDSGGGDSYMDTGFDGGGDGD